MQLLVFIRLFLSVKGLIEYIASIPERLTDSGALFSAARAILALGCSLWATASLHSYCKAKGPPSFMTVCHSKQRWSNGHFCGLESCHLRHLIGPRPPQGDGGRHSSTACALLCCSSPRGCSLWIPCPMPTQTWAAGVPRTDPGVVKALVENLQKLIQLQPQEGRREVAVDSWER